MFWQVSLQADRTAEEGKGGYWSERGRRRALRAPLAVNKSVSARWNSISEEGEGPASERGGEMVYFNSVYSIHNECNKDTVSFWAGSPSPAGISTSADESLFRQNPSQSIDFPFPYYSIASSSKYDAFSSPQSQGKNPLAPLADSEESSEASLPGNIGLLKQSAKGSCHLILERKPA